MTKYLSDLDLAARYSVDRGTVWRWARDGDFPQPHKLSKNCTRWIMADVEAWEERRAAAA